MAVVAFHIFPDAVNGGFIGVDIFFTLSGFVISINYLPDLVAGRTTFRSFFARRVRRLLPAALVMVMTVTAVSLYLLPPVLLKAFAGTLAAQGVYFQNFAFWVEGDYFEAAYQKPLLHTWSLAVEEQFYFLFPLLIFAFRKGFKFGATALCIASVASFFAGTLVAGITPKTVFYLLPFRVWEFTGGVAVALWYQYGTSGGRLPQAVANVVIVIGALLIGASILVFDERASLPGPQALLAITGTMAILAAQSSVSARVVRLTCNGIVQHIGLTSYSWYLWHWPLAVFFYIITGRLPGVIEGIVLIGFSYALGTVSYTALEKGNSCKAWLAGTMRPAAAALTALALTSGVAALVFLTTGMMFRYPPAEARLLQAQMDHTDGRCSYVQRLRDGGEICRIGSASEPGGVLIFGDSHAAKIKDAVKEIADQRRVPIYLTKRNCQPTIVGVTAYCSTDWFDDVMRDAHDRGISRILVVAHYAIATTDADYTTGFNRFVQAGIPVIFLSSPPEGQWFDPQSQMPGAPRIDPVSAEQVYRARRGQRRALEKLDAASTAVSVIDPVPLICPTGLCLRDHPKTDQPLFSDDNHLSTAGVEKVLPLIEPLIRL